MKFLTAASFVPMFFSVSALGEVPKVGENAPLFKLKNQAGKEFDLASRKGAGWTILFFYPKAGTPGCTKQACAFRDSIEVIRKQNAEVYGISADTQADQAKFHKKEHLKFDLLADPDAKVISAYDVKMPVVDMAKRWTFVIDPELKVRWVNDKVDPALDAKTVSDKLKELQGDSSNPKK